MNIQKSPAYLDDENMTDAALDVLAVQLLADGLSPQVPATQSGNSLQRRVLSRVAKSVADHRGFRTVRRNDQLWKQLGKGVRACVLHDNGVVSSAFVEFDPGSRLPGHRHFAHEECMVLRGSLSTGDLAIDVHDYHRAQSGSKHLCIRSEEGALIFLRGTSIGRGVKIVRELVSAWLPARGAEPITVRANQEAWHDAGDGARVKPLWMNGESASLLVSLEAGGRLPAHTTVQEEEYLTIAGEVFLGDILLRGGDYQMAPRAAAFGEITSDVGGLLFVHTNAEFARVA